MKKGKLLLGIILPMVAMSATGCGFLKNLFNKEDSGKKYAYNFDIKGGTKQEKEALLAAANGILATAVGDSTVNLKPGVKETLKEDEGTIVVLPYEKQGKAEDKSKHTVTFTWKVGNSAYCGDLIDMSAEKSKKLQINYKGWTAANKNGPDESDNVKFEIEKIVCGGATASSPNMKYELNVQNAMYHHVDISIAEINKVTDGLSTHNEKDYPSTFDMVDYDQQSPYFIKDPLNEGTEKDYYYVNVKGKIIYYAPDGNWALLADGDQVIELYAGSALNLTPSGYPYMAQNDGWVVVSGNLSQYCGNIQIGFITQISPLTDHTGCTEPTMDYKDLDLSKFEIPASYGYTCQKQAIDGFSNSLAKITGTVVQCPSSFSNARFTFTVQTAGGKSLVCAYDYHTDREGSLGLYNKLKGLANGKTVTIKGTMRYAGNDSSPFILSGNSGVWNLVPFLTEHVTIS